MYSDVHHILELPVYIFIQKFHSVSVCNLNLFFITLFEEISLHFNFNNFTHVGFIHFSQYSFYWVLMGEFLF